MAHEINRRGLLLGGLAVTTLGGCQVTIEAGVRSGVLTTPPGYRTTAEMHTIAKKLSVKMFGTYEFNGEYADSARRLLNRRLRIQGLVCREFHHRGVRMIACTSQRRIDKLRRQGPGGQFTMVYYLRALKRWGIEPPIFMDFHLRRAWN